MESGRATKARDPAKDFRLAADDPEGIWSDGATMWVANDDEIWNRRTMVYAYSVWQPPQPPRLTGSIPEQADARRAER